MKYHIFIDETGNFGKKSKVRYNTDFIAGWVSSGTFPHNLKQTIDNAVAPHNRDIEETSGKEYILKIPDDLHFIPLHRPERRTNADSTITIPVSWVQPMMTSIFDSLDKKVLFAFRSTGFPRYYANEQAAYIEILRATILQILDRIELKKEDCAEILIASRRIRQLMGEYGFENSNEYERNICDNLIGEITEVFADKSMAERIKITMESARRSLPLAVADLFCGALREEKNNYLEEYKKQDRVKRFSIHKAFTYLSNRAVSRIKHLFDQDHTMGLMLGFENLAANPQNNDLRKVVEGMCRTIDSEDSRLFENELKSYIDEKLIQDPNRYENLDFIKTLLDEVEKQLNTRRIKAVSARSRIIISCHKGEVDLADVQRHLDFLDKHGAEIFDSMYNAAQERLETVLFMVQSAAFNVFRFEEVEEYLSEEIQRYDRMFSLKENPGTEARIDETRARLEGSIGQMYGFLCDYPEGEIYHDEAEQHLKNDVKHCVAGSPFWVQGMGYLTSFYFKRGDLEKTADSFMLETQSPKSSRKKLFDLSELDAFSSQKSGFFLLHRLYVCVLGLRHNMEITGEGELKNQLLQEETSVNYPIFLTMKWLGVIYAIKGDLNTALVLFERAAMGENQGFTIDVIKLPIKILIHACRKEMGKRSRFNLVDEMKMLEKKVPGISKNLNRLGIQKYMSLNDTFDWYESAGLMPFYYS